MAPGASRLVYQWWNGFELHVLVYHEPTRTVKYNYFGIASRLLTFQLEPDQDIAAFTQLIHDLEHGQVLAAGGDSNSSADCIRKRHDEITALMFRHQSSKEQIMYTMYFGYISSFIVLFIVCALLNLPNHPDPVMGAIAFFVLLPLLVIGISSEVIWAVPTRYKSAVAESISKGDFSKARAFFVGIIVGLSGICLSLGIFILGSWMELSGLLAFAGFFMIFIIVSLFPAIGAIWLVEAACRFQIVQAKKEVSGMEGDIEG